MKATGIVRRIDDLGRVVIPKEIRRTMRIREGDPLEIYTDRDGSVIFKKYSLMGGLTEFAGQLCDTLNRTTGRTAVITDRDNIISVSGAPRRELMDKQISPDLERLMEGRQIYQHKGGEDGIPLCDCAGVGDSENDLPMLQAVGTPIAMGNAAPAVKAAACRIAPSNGEDGVAQAILSCLSQAAL